VRSNSSSARPRPRFLLVPNGTPESRNRPPARAVSVESRRGFACVLSLRQVEHFPQFRGRLRMFVGRSPRGSPFLCVSTMQTVPEREMECYTHTRHSNGQCLEWNWHSVPSVRPVCRFGWYWSAQCQPVPRRNGCLRSKSEVLEGKKKQIGRLGR
jgi:hypothetical protein